MGKINIALPDEIPFPKKGDKAFSPGGPARTLVDMRWFSALDKDISVAQAFRQTADHIVEAVESGEGNLQADAFFFAVGYLYRHYIELEMKTLVRWGLRLGLLENSENIKRALNKHELDTLWSGVKHIVRAMEPDGSAEDLDAAESIIMEFHTVDGDGQGFRYGQTRHGKPLLTGLPQTVNLGNLRRVMSGLSTFFCGVDGLLDAAHGASQ